MPKGEGFTVVEVVAVLIILGAVTMVSYLAIPVF
jgi:prepilin-type N-terminal cleavage/methylation domain-containing protein